MSDDSYYPTEYYYEPDCFNHDYIYYDYSPFDELECNHDPILSDVNAQGNITGLTEPQAGPSQVSQDF